MHRFDSAAQHQSDYLMGNFQSAHWPQSHLRHHLLMCRHLSDGGKLTLTNFHFTHYRDGHAVEQINLPGIVSLYVLSRERFGLGVGDVKHGFTEDELAAVVAALDTYPEAGKQGYRRSCRMRRHCLTRFLGTIKNLSPILRGTGSPPNW